MMIFLNKPFFYKDFSNIKTFHFLRKLFTGFGIAFFIA